MLNKLLYCFKTAFQNLAKSAMLNAIAASTIAITFIIFVSFLIIILNLAAFKKNWADQIQVVLYFKDTAPADSIATTKASIEALGEVKSVTFISRDDALNMLRESLKGQDGILEGLTGNPLAPSLEIKLKDDFQSVERVEALVKKIAPSEYIDDIEYGQRWLERFTALFDLLKITGFSLGGLLFIFTLFIVSNTIKLTMYTRRDEIEIMKLVGATNRFIKLPFCLEGIIQGLLGAACAVAFLFIMAKIFTAKFISFIHLYIGTENFIFLDVTLTLYILLLGAALGLTGSLFALSSMEEFQS
ncbi:MAG: permease-like cell division protein FtsX [Pseudomonadota bacterium]